MSVTQLFALALSAILAENFVLVKFLGICPFLGVSKKTDTAVGMGLAVTFVMGLGSMFTWVVNTFLLVPLGLQWWRCFCAVPSRRSTRHWASICPLSPPTAPFWAWPC